MFKVQSVNRLLSPILIVVAALFVVRNAIKQGAQTNAKQSAIVIVSEHVICAHEQTLHTHTHNSHAHTNIENSY